MASNAYFRTREMQARLCEADDGAKVFGPHIEMRQLVDYTKSYGRTHQLPAQVLLSESDRVILEYKYFGESTYDTTARRDAGHRNNLEGQAHQLIQLL